MRIFAQGWSNGFDGPGRRYVYYLKGCNFRCLWCGNPESIAPEPEMLFYPGRSEFAAQSCPFDAVTGEELDRSRCRECAGRPCIEQWCDRAFEYCGRELATAELVAGVTERRALFGTDGGVTFSGGEPTLQPDALLEAARALRAEGIHLTLETNASSPRFAELAAAFDLMICDLKSVTPELHRRLTGADNRTVLENLSGPVRKVIRVPLIAGVNFTPEEQDRMTDFLRRAVPEAVELLPLHHLGAPKFRALGQPYPAESMQPPPPDAIERFARRLRDAGIRTTIA